MAATERPRILIISGDQVDRKMGGMGARYWEMAQTLASDFEVILAVPNGTTLFSPDFDIRVYNLEKGSLRLEGLLADLIVLQGFVLHFHPYLRELGVPLAVDLYVPFLLESLVWHRDAEMSSWMPAYEEYLRVQLELLRAGDFFFCANERQRDYWLGWLHAQKRINPHTFLQDPTLRKLIDVVPMGLPSAKPQPTRRALKGIHPGIGPEDKVILWAGGLWDWLDPLTLIRALAEVVPDHPELKLFFMGSRHPNPRVSGMTMTESAERLSRELGLDQRQVFFGDWVPYDERINYLLESDFSVVSHPPHIETDFSFRTRVLDCIWTGLPLIITEGDSMAQWVKQFHLGVTVPPLDVTALSAAIRRMLTQPKQEYEQRFQAAREVWQWKQLIQPLRRFCLAPAPAPDKGLYLTETERIGGAKDAFLDQVVREKDQQYAAMIREKDLQRDQIVREKDLQRDQIIHEKDLQRDQIVHEKDTLQKTIFRQEGEAREKENLLAHLTQDKMALEATLQRYQASLPFRIYRAVKPWINKPRRQA